MAAVLAASCLLTDQWLWEQQSEGHSSCQTVIIKERNQQNCFYLPSHLNMCGNHVCTTFHTVWLNKQQLDCQVLFKAENLMPFSCLTSLWASCHDRCLFFLCDPVRFGILERCKELVEAGYDVRQPDKENVTLLHWAAINNRLELVK